MDGGLLKDGSSRLIDDDLDVLVWSFYVDVEDRRAFGLMREAVGCTQQHPHRTAALLPDR